MKKIAVTGATGHLGGLAIAALRAKGAAPIALARTPSKAAPLGVEARAFDYTAADPAALAGVETLVLVSSNDFNDRAGQHRNVIAAAKAAGVGRILYTSILKGPASPMILAQDHIATEAALAESGLAVTLLRNGWYFENYASAVAMGPQHGAILGASGEGRISAAARADFAEAIAVTALDGGHAGKAYELAGDSAFSMAEFAAELARQTGKAVAYQNLAQADYARTLISFGLPEGFASVLADSDATAAKEALFDDSRTLSRLIGRPTATLTAAIASALAG